MDADKHPEPDKHEPEHIPSLDKQIARARREMGEARWRQLNKEWN